MATKLKIVIAEDSESVRVLLELQLRDLKQAEFFDAHDGLEALVVVRRQLPDLLITDISMPNMDGIALIKAIRADVNPEVAKIPIMVITAGTHEEKFQSLQAGADLVLSKPVKTKSVRDSVLILTR